MIEVSVVSGTYNRLKYLRQMVQSVRASLGGRIPYEVVVVDGGSSDGTQQWCKSQSDIRLIEQRSLLGAVIAFNAGARAAVGRYVILANDDIAFNDRSILRAISFMEQRQDVGIGCFYQDRGGRAWHVEEMPAVLDGRQVSVPYGQVCIVPRWLGDAVGWWGSITRTYGGDNELSCNVLELGLKVEPIQCACISDFIPDDELRRINNTEPRKVAESGGTHPDTAAWTKKWTRNGMVGPVISKQLLISISPAHTQHRHRILYAPIYEPRNEQQRQTKVGLLKALQKKALVYEFDYMAAHFGDLLEVCQDFQPTLFLTQIQSIGSPLGRKEIDILRRNYRQAKFVNWNGDYHKENLLSRNYMELMRQFDLATFVTADIEVEYRRHGIPYRYWQIGYEESSAEPDANAPRYDVVFLGNAYSAKRHDLGRMLSGLVDSLRIGLFGSWPVEMRSGYTLYDFDAGNRIYKASRLAVSDQQWPDATGYVSNRLFQAMAAGGCMLLQQHFDGMEHYLGLQDGVHLRTWNTLEELKHLLFYYCVHEAERRRIADAGHKYVLEHHSFDRRVEELFSWL